MNQNIAAKRKFWKQQIADWEKSGESGRRWSARQGHNYQTFLYWKSRFHLSLKPEDFIELAEKKTSKLLIQFRDVQIELDEHFHTETLAQVLLIIKGALC
jgi:hypothetical protein